MARGPWPDAGPFDAVMCRNVLMYLAADERRAALERIVGLMAPNALLVLDPAEHPGPAARLFVDHGGGIYTVRRR
ncbi:MAG: hypothetical protein FJX37_07060 [Alphaproteobacteria bacterium]|nr:hypothetical protein [Alphaproteobacteria bacterium]